MRIIRDIILLNVLTAIGGFLIGLSAHGRPLSELVNIIGLSNVIFLTVGFFIIGCITKENRFSYLRTLAIIEWLASIINVFAFNNLVTFQLWLFSIIFVFFTMLVGGGISLLFVPNRITNTGSTNNLVPQIQTWFLGIVTVVATEVIKEIALSVIK